MGSAPAPIRLAILEADTPQPKTNAKYGGYRGVFLSLFQRACASTNPPQELSTIVSLSAHHVVNELDPFPALSELDAILITGSKHNAFDNDPWIVRLVEYTAQALASGVRVIGVCFGHQILGRAVGMKVERSNKGWEVAVTEVQLTDKGKEIFGMDKMVSTWSTWSGSHNPACSG
jgi:GMP synthase-like glutamine amidotransferase